MHRAAKQETMLEIECLAGLRGRAPAHTLVLLGERQRMADRSLSVPDGTGPAGCRRTRHGGVRACVPSGPGQCSTGNDPLVSPGGGFGVARAARSESPANCGMRRRCLRRSKTRGGRHAREAARRGIAPQVRRMDCGQIARILDCSEAAARLLLLAAYDLLRGRLALYETARNLDYIAQ